MRKAGKKRIAAALVQFEDWKRKLEPRIEKILAEAQPIAREWMESVRQRIIEGDLGACTVAQARSTVRMIEDFESGRYVGVTETGGFHCARMEL